MYAFLDTPFDPDFPVYTRANAGEILPEPVTPLAWSVSGPGFEEGFRVAFCDSFGLLPRPGIDRPYQMVGRMAARLHLNLSVIRTTAQRLPGTSADVVDVQYFGDAVADGLPNHEPSSQDRRYRLTSPPQLGRTMAGMGRRVDRDRERVDELTAEVSAALDEPSTSSAALVRLVRRGAAELGVQLGTHVSARGLTSPLLEQAVSALGRAGIAPEDALAHVADIPDLESAKPSRALAAIAATIPPDGALAAVVAEGSLDSIERSDAPGARDLYERLVGFVDEFGHRGVGEFDPTRPAWGQRPDDVVRLLSRLGAEPIHGADTVDADPGRIARNLIAAARSAMFRAERTKDNTMRATNVLRRLLFALRDRLTPPLGDITADRFLMLTLDEVEAIVHGGDGPTADELDRRVADYAAAVAVEPAEWSNGALRLVEPATSQSAGSTDEDGATLTGIAGSPGRATGRVRVLTDPYGDFEDGDVLVAHMTDTAWTPLFLAAAAVVTDVGGVLSHATIVARDLGIPAVVNTKRACGVLSDGDLVEVDGTAGTVTVVERA